MKALAGLGLALLISGVSVAKDVCKGVEEKIREHTKGRIPFKVLDKRPSNGSCQVIAKLPNGNLLPIYVYDSYLLVGTKFVKGESPTIQRMAEVERELMKELLQKLSSFKYVSYKPKNIKEGRYFYFISDPDCPFCQRMKGKVKELADKYGWEVRVVWLPLSIHPKAEGKVVSFLCENKTYEDYLKDSYGEKECEEGKKHVRKALREILPYVSGTPTFIFPNGTVVSGAVPEKLEELMKQ